MHHTHTSTPTPETSGRTIHWAGRYDFVTNLMLLGKEHSLREMTANMAGIQPGDRILDVGCGTGSLTLAAQARVGATGEVHGIDASPEMIDVARLKADKAHVNIDFRVALIERLPFSDGYFDLVLSSLMLHHLPDDLKRQGFAEIYRVLKSGGHLFAVDFEPPTNAFIRGAASHLLGHGMMQVDVRMYVPMLQAAGFKNVQSGRTKSSLLSFVSGTK